MNETNETTERPALAFYHANAKGTGSAIRLELCPAKVGGDGHILAHMAKQASVDARMWPPQCSMFDWEHAIELRLSFDDICSVIQVFRGETESIEEGRGIWHDTPTHGISIRLRRIIDPVCGYLLEAFARERKTGAADAAHIVFNCREALGLCETLAGSLSRIAFG